MSLDLIEIAIQLAVIALGYAIGGGIVFIVFRVAGFPVTFDQATLLVLALPLIATLLLETFTGLWRHTPGSLGLGGFVAFIPMLIAGAGIAIAAVTARKLMLPFDPSFPRESGSLSGWLLLAFTCTGFSLALWRYWPAPTPRLW